MSKRSFAQWYHNATAGLSLSIRTRVILSYLIIVGAGFFLLTRKISSDVRPRYLEAEEETMVDIANILAAMAEQSWEGGHDGEINLARFEAAFESARQREFTAPIYAVTKSTVDLHISITDASGRVIFDSDDKRRVGADHSHFNDVYLTLRGKYGARSTRAVTSDSSSSILHVAAPIRRGGEIVGVLTVIKPLASMAAFMERTQRRVILLGSAAAGGAVLLGVIFSAWLTYPIRNLIGYAEAIRDGRRTPRPHLGHSELRTLGSALEEMRDALEGKDYINRYVETLTHEMKSPVAAIRGAAELLQEEMPAEDRQRFLANIQSESARIEEAVDSLLLLANVEARKALDHAEPVDLGRLAEAALEQVAVRASVRAVRITCDLPSGAFVRGDAFLLERTLLNLLENAIAFTPEEGALWLAVRESEAGGDSWQVMIEDSGPGIPAFALSRVFERFYSLPRPGTGRKSSGLGLAFAREAILLHGGTVELVNRDEGGARAIVSLPKNC